MKVLSLYSLPGNSYLSKKNKIILLTGATGAVGPLVVKAFHDAGYSIRTLSIEPPPVGIGLMMLMHELGCD